MSRRDRARTPSTTHRTDEEREHDRRERERRRNSGASQPPAPPPPAAPHPPAEPAVEEPIPLAQLARETAPPPSRRAPAPAAYPRRPRRRLGGLVLAGAFVVLLIAGTLLVAAVLKRHHAAPPPEPKVVTVVIPEGETRAQIAEIARAHGLTGNYRDASQRSRVLDMSVYGAPRGTASLEGFLFPATYELNAGESVKALVEKQLIAFRENFTKEDARRAHELGITPYELLTVASMIEREAQVPGDRPKIAAVIYNRLRAGVPLGIDATIYYAVEQAKGVATYTHELTEAQLHIDSPYNTRLHKGLPPTPISNPGVASIQAAAHPSHASYLYYVAGADGCGEQVFSNTAAEFEADVAAYDAAVNANGGHPPKCEHK